VVQVCEIARLGVQPGFVRRVEGAYERERAPELVHHFLVVAVLALHAFVAPAPIRRQLPVGEVGGQLVRDAIAKRTVGAGHINAECERAPQHAQCTPGNRGTSATRRISGMTDGLPAITYEVLYEDVPTPARATREAAGYDACAYLMKR